MNKLGLKYILTVFNEFIDLESDEILEEIYSICYKSGGSSTITKKHRNIIYQIGIILNISWILEALDYPVDIICQTSIDCPRQKSCEKISTKRRKISWTNQIKQEILTNKK